MCVCVCVNIYIHMYVYINYLYIYSLFPPVVGSSISVRQARTPLSACALTWTLQDILLHQGFCVQINHRFIALPYLHCPHYCNIVARLLRNVRPPPNPFCMAYIHHTILVMVISCKGQALTPFPPLDYFSGSSVSVLRARTPLCSVLWPYVLNRYSRIPGTQPHGYEYRIPPGEPCIGQEHVHIQLYCIHKTG